MAPEKEARWVNRLKVIGIYLLIPTAMLSSGKIVYTIDDKMGNINKIPIIINTMENVTNRVGTLENKRHDDSIRDDSYMTARYQGDKPQNPKYFGKTY